MGLVGCGSHTLRLLMRTSLALGAALVLISGCDAVQSTQAPRTTVSLATHAAASGDVLYDLEPLAPGETFDIGLDLGDESLGLRSTRHAAGYALTFEPAVRQRPDSVVVRYLVNGTEVAPSHSFSGDAESYDAGDSEDGPDSWHYAWQNGSWVLMKDYKRGEDGEAAGTTAFTTPSGQTVEVTDVEFRVYGLDTAAPSEVQFETPGALRINEKAFGRTLR